MQKKKCTLFPILLVCCVLCLTVLVGCTASGSAAQPQTTESTGQPESSESLESSGQASDRDRTVFSGTEPPDRETGLVSELDTIWLIF